MKTRLSQLRVRARLDLALFRSPKANAVPYPIPILIIAAAMEIATAVIGLLPICASGCSFIVGLCKAHENVQEQMIRIRMQRAVSHP